MKVSYIATILLLVAAFVLGIVSLGGASVPWGHVDFELFYGCIPGQNGTCDAGAYCDANGICRDGQTSNPVSTDAYLIVNSGLTRYYYCRQAEVIEFSTTIPCFPDIPCGSTCAHTSQQVRAFTIIACISCVCAMIAIVYRAKKGGRSLSVAGTLLLAVVFFAAAWGSWLGGCHKEMQDTSGWGIPSAFELDAGFFISLVAFLLTVITSFFQICVPAGTQNAMPSRPDGPPPQAMSMGPAEKVETEPPNETDPDSPDRPPRPSTSAIDPAPSSAPAGARSDQPVAEQGGYTPTSAGKALHFSSLGGLIMALVCGILSISMATLPWTSYNELYVYTWGALPPPPLDPDGQTIISATLTGWDVCIYANEYSFTSQDPNACYKGGKVIIGLMSIAISFSFISIALIYLRGRDKGINAGWLKIVSLICFFIAMTFFLVSFALWMSPSGCAEELEQELNQGLPSYVYLPLSLSAGFALAVVAFVATVLALIVHFVSVCSEWRSGEGGDRRVNTDDNGGGYTSLLDSDVPYL